MAEMSQEEALAQQKANCPFCKIVAGEIPSKKVYEDDEILAILDINPAQKGHLLVLPKEHYFILPLVPPKTFAHMFVTARKLMKAMKKGLIVPRVTEFIANGGAAGQQSPHFLFHLIPREPGDNLDHLDLGERSVNQKEIAPSIAQNYQAIMRNHLARTDSAAAKKARVQQPTGVPPKPVMQAEEQVEQIPQSPPKSPQERLTALFDLLKQEPELHQLIMQSPEKVEDYAKSNPLLSQVFEGIDLKELSRVLQEQQNTQSTPPKEKPAQAPVISTPIVEKELPEKPIAPPTEPGTSDVPHAANLSQEELIVYLKEKPKLLTLLRDDPAQLEELAKTNPRIKKFFEGTTVAAIASRITDEEQIDFNELAKYLEANK